jgi:hypothetical protein
MIMKNLFIVAMVIALVGTSFLLAGCLNPSVPPTENQSQTQTQNITPGVVPTDDESVVTPFSAKEGLNNATSAIMKLYADSALVQVFGECDSKGKSTEWQYSFNSKAAMTGYDVSVPNPEHRTRNTQYTVRRSLPTQWVDSSAAVSACGISGECTLEMNGDKPVWIILSDSETCTADAESGVKLN